MRNYLTRAFPIFIGLIFLAAPSIVDACPNCKDGLHQNYLAIAFGLSVLFMIAMPFAIMAAWTYFIYYVNRSVSREGDN